MPPNTEMTTRKSVIDEAVKTRFANSRRSISGLLARSAWRTKSARISAPASAGTSTSAAPKPPAEPDSASP